MTSFVTTGLEKLSVAEQRHVAKSRSRFEREWQSGTRPNIAAFLGSHTVAERKVLFGELLLLEWELRQRRGEQPTPLEYVTSFPNDAVLIQILFAQNLPAVPAAPDVNCVSATINLPSVQSVSDEAPPIPRPTGLVTSRTPHITREVQTLLQSRLRLLVLLNGIAALAYLVASFVGESDLLQFATWQVTMLISLVALMSLLGVWLWRQRGLSVIWLRRIELVTFSAWAAALILDQMVGYPLVRVLKYATIDHQADVATMYADARSLGWILLIIGYGTLIPNTGRRCATVVVLLATMALLGETASSLHNGTEAFLGPVLFEMSLWLSLSCAAAIYGSHRISILRQEAFELRQLGQYRLKKQIGRGGMGTVYLAEHQLLKRPCAVKVIRPDRTDDPSMLARFEREVHATAKLSHWNSVEIFDYGRTDDDTFYYVMEYLPGFNLSELVGKFGPLPPARAVYLMRQVCAALSEAHAHGLIHRDIKPGNVIACERGGHYDVAKLLDFGLVQPLQFVSDSNRLTLTGSIAGTPDFMSPEQAAGETHIDARSDLYSVGAVTFYLLTGRTPFVADTPMKALAAHMYEPVPSPAELRRDIPADVEAIVLRCLAKNPEDRFHSAAELESAFAACDCFNDWNSQIAAEWTLHASEDKVC